MSPGAEPPAFPTPGGGSGAGGIGGWRDERSGGSQGCLEPTLAQPVRTAGGSCGEGSPATWLQSQLFSHLPPWILPGSLKLWLPPSSPSSVSWALRVALVVKNLPARLLMAGDGRDCGFSPWAGRSPAEGNGNPLQYSCLENPIDRGAWWAALHGACKGSDTSERVDMHTQAPSLPGVSGRSQAGPRRSPEQGKEETSSAPGLPAPFLPSFPLLPSLPSGAFSLSFCCSSPVSLSLLLNLIFGV